MTYGCRSGEYCSGPYLFLPDGEAAILAKDFPLIIHINGQLVDQVHILGIDLVNSHILRLYKQGVVEQEAFEVENIVELRGNKDIEIGLRFDSEIQNGSPPIFATDQNCFQVCFSKINSILNIHLYNYLLT